MSHSFPFVARLPSGASKPSNCYSGLSEQLQAVSLATSASDAKVEVGSSGPECKKVVVVGAGIAGLRAASVLQRHGVEVTILEARDRIGGRIFTTRKEGTATRDIGTSE